MPLFYVNKNQQDSRDGKHNEVHQENVCPHPPLLENRVPLGEHASCHSAKTKAKNIGYPMADGCYYCANECHTG